MCSRFHATPKESHVKQAKWILRYLKETQNLVLFFPAGDSFDLIGYVKVDFADFLIDRNNT